ncbi:hypothetical protein O6H91_18G064600 [Diphasiastrum complanatum]|uniref:Uncharacterized protein n=1 Tax=Diphasiastrum complanatum TaxID=34168 RepID=A0ACC2B2A5_DIPCM|nr:hypothetical protein O6H91_18G064600 [Diphasiastrum complanatum]
MQSNHPNFLIVYTLFSEEILPQSHDVRLLELYHLQFVTGSQQNRSVHLLRHWRKTLPSYLSSVDALQFPSKEKSTSMMHLLFALDSRDAPQVVFGENILLAQLVSRQTACHLF